MSGEGQRSAQGKAQVDAALLGTLPLAPHPLPPGRGETYLWEGARVPRGHVGATQYHPSKRASGGLTCTWGGPEMLPACISSPLPFPRTGNFRKGSRKAKASALGELDSTPPPPRQGRFVSLDQCLRRQEAEGWGPSLAGGWRQGGGTGGRLKVTGRAARVAHAGVRGSLRRLSSPSSPVHPRAILSVQRAAPWAGVRGLHHVGVIQPRLGGDPSTRLLTSVVILDKT